MPLSPELDQRIRKRFDELIKEAVELIQQLEAAHAKSHPTTDLEIISTFYEAENPFISDCQALVVNALNLVNMVFGNSERGRELSDDLKNHTSVNKGKVFVLNYIVGTLKGLQSDYEHGFIVDLDRRILSNVSTEFMSQVEGLLDEGQPGQYDHVPAAVLCGAVLEDALRRLCERQTPQVATGKPNGQPKNLSALIDDLQKANAFNKLKAQQLRGWAQVRNSAAHGKFDEFSRDDVELMVHGVKNFLADYL